MTIQGSFYDIDNNRCEVLITKDDGNNETLTIGENGLFFSGEPITIETDLESTFDPIIRKSCTINLLTKNYIGDLLWSENANNISVSVTKGNDVIFLGFVEPNTFSQPFVELDQFSINCIDAISALQYYNYKDIRLNDYAQAKSEAGNITFRQILLQSMGIATGTQNYNPSLVGWRVYYDCSKGLTQGNESTIFNDLGISENVFLGETFDDIWTCQDVVSEILQYLNLHIIQQGVFFYVFDWETLKQRRNMWFDLNKNRTLSLTQPMNVTLTGQMHGANDTTITVSDVYNQVSVKCDLNNIETVITSPLDDDSLTSPYSGKQLYMREYISEGNGQTAMNAFRDMVKENGSTITHDKAKYIDWYLRFMNNPNWILHTNNGTGNIMDTIKNTAETYSNGKFINQWKIPHILHYNRLWSAILRMGSIERDAKVKDNAPTAKVSMNDYLVIAVNGNEVDDNNNAVPTVSELQNHSPLIEFVGGNGGVFSPNDDDTTNYLVFSGKILLQPITEESHTTGEATGFTELRNKANTNNFWASTVPSDNDDHGRFYTRKYFTTVNPSDTPNENVWLNDMSLQPWTKDKANHLLQYNYSEAWGTQDTVAKLPILECELIIGNKRLIETDIDQWGNSTFEWVTLGSEPTETYEGETYTITTFTLGVNPKIGDYIIGTEFQLQNTISVEMNVDAEGTAIPIKKSDNLSGAIQFRILGPVNTTWNDITRRHPTWFRHTAWYENNKIVLAHLESIMIKDLSCKIYSDNALAETFDNDELIYVSNETDRYINKHDDTEFKFITQPTSDDIITKGLKGGANINAVIDMNSGTPIASIYNATTLETAKAEEHFVDQYYNEYSTPKIEMQMTVHNGNNINWRNNYQSIPLDKNFYVVAMNEDVRSNTSTIKLKSK